MKSLKLVNQASVKIVIDLFLALIADIMRCLLDDKCRELHIGSKNRRQEANRSILKNGLILTNSNIEKI